MTAPTRWQSEPPRRLRSTIPERTTRQHRRHVAGVSILLTLLGLVVAWLFVTAVIESGWAIAVSATVALLGLIALVIYAVHLLEP